MMPKALSKCLRQSWSLFRSVNWNPDLAAVRCPVSQETKRSILRKLSRRLTAEACCWPREPSPRAANPNLRTPIMRSTSKTKSYA